MRILKLTKDSQKNILESLLKRSPNNYTAVSYTHLGHLRKEKCRLKLLIAEALSSAFCSSIPEFCQLFKREVIVFVPVCVRSVSYTQLMEIVTRDPFSVMTKIKNAGAIFIGEYSSEPWGDYFAGPNHVLPTNEMCIRDRCTPLYEDLSPKLRGGRRSACDKRGEVFSYQQQRMLWRL